MYCSPSVSVPCFSPEWLSTVDLLVLIRIDQLHHVLKLFFTFVTKQANLMGRSNLQSLSLQVVFPASDQTGLESLTSLY
jgi:hypothetical protein